MTEQNNQQASQPQGPAFVIQRIYLKDISFETPMGHDVFTKQYKPAIQQDLNIQTNKVDEHNYEVVLLLTITARIDNRVAFLVEIKQAGMFGIAGMDAQAITQLANTTCPQILFPYAREAIDSILGRGTFPPLLLPPINFDAVFVQAIEAANKQQTEQAMAEKPEVVN